VLSDEKRLSALFSTFKKQLKKLLMIRLADNDYVPTDDELQQHLEGAPRSWTLGRRATREVDSVQLVWPIPISELRSAAQRCCTERRLVKVECSGMSAPLGGMTWSMVVQATWDAERQATQLGLYCKPRNAPHKVWYRYMCQFDVEGAPELARNLYCPRVMAVSTLGA
jgi:hypothetical protein